MQRGTTGRYEVTTVGGEQVHAFVPHPLPPDPPLQMGLARQRLLEQATLALGRLDSVSLLLPDPNLFLYAYVRREEADEYRAANIFWVPQEARWSFLPANARQPTIGKTLDEAMPAIERENPSLKGVLPKLICGEMRVPDAERIVERCA